MYRQTSQRSSVKLSIGRALHIKPEEDAKCLSRGAPVCASLTLNVAASPPETRRALHISQKKGKHPPETGGVRHQSLEGRRRGGQFGKFLWDDHPGRSIR